MTEKKLIAVYGSLRKDMYNHRLLDQPGAVYVKTETFNIPFKMIPYSSFPALIPDIQNNDILMEIYEVDPTTYRRVEILEGYPNFYDKEPITDSEGNVAEVYVIRDTTGMLQERYREQPSIVDWSKYYNEHLA